MWLAHICTQLENLGIPAVGITTTDFQGLAKSAAEGWGVPDLPWVVVPHPLELIPKEQVEAKADAAIDDIIRAATQWKPSTADVLSVKPYPAETVKLKGTVKDVNDIFFKKGWSIGVPFIPPTRRSVDEMLKGTSRHPDEVLWQVPPRAGALTVELTAVHAVMAGAKPEYMPVIIAIIEAMKEPKYAWPSAAVTTGTMWPVAIVNGPIVKELNIACGTGAGGRDNQANISIGLTINTIVDVVGGSKYPSISRACVGNAAQIVATVLGENEEASPWEPYHVEMGYNKMENYVTVKNAFGFGLLGTNGMKAQDLLKSFARSAATTKDCFTGAPESFTAEEIMLIAPQVADHLAREGWTKDRVRNFIWENARQPISAWPSRWEGRSGCVPPKWFVDKYSPITPDTLVYSYNSPEMIKIFVVGGPGTHSYYYRGGMGRIITKPITK